MKNILFIFGTRPEAIKLAPLIKAFQADSSYRTSICLTGQHKEMLEQVMDFFSLKADINLMVMEPNQSLFTLTSKLILQLEKVFDDFQPDLVFVQGDTTTVMVGALAAFYKKVKIAHIEAGLRSHQRHSPFPEEMNRLLASRLSTFHFTPTPLAQKNLLDEGVQDGIHQVGNTVIDALFLGLTIVEKNMEHYKQRFGSVDFSKRIVLVTCHRRESFGPPFEEICNALLHLAAENTDIQIVYPVHLNPNIKAVASKLLQHERILLMEPLDYPHLLYILNQSYIVITDSGGIQEEAPSLGKPVLVIRDVTERTEGIDAGTAQLVGTSFLNIVESAQALLDHPNRYQEVAMIANPYGDGEASLRIKSVIDHHRNELLNV